MARRKSARRTRRANDEYRSRRKEARRNQRRGAAKTVAVGAGVAIGVGRSRAKARRRNAYKPAGSPLAPMKIHGHRGQRRNAKGRFA